MCETVFDKTCRKCTHILFVRPHQLSRADASVSRDRLTNSFTTKALHQRGATVHLLVRPSFRFFRFHFLSHNSPISRFCPSDDASYGERARTPVPNTNRDVVVAEEMKMSSSSVRLASRSSSVVARARGDRSTPRRARAHPRYRRLRRSIDRSKRRVDETEARETRVWWRFFLISHFLISRR